MLLVCHECAKPGTDDNPLTTHEDYLYHAACWLEASLPLRPPWRTQGEIIEAALANAEPAAAWLGAHPPGARLPDHLEPGYEDDRAEQNSMHIQAQEDEDPNAWVYE